MMLDAVAPSPAPSPQCKWQFVKIKIEIIQSFFRSLLAAMLYCVNLLGDLGHTYVSVKTGSMCSQLELVGITRWCGSLIQLAT